jgi:hypothetical protein
VLVGREPEQTLVARHVDAAGSRCGGMVVHRAVGSEVVQDLAFGAA